MPTGAIYGNRPRTPAAVPANTRDVAAPAPTYVPTSAARIAAKKAADAQAKAEKDAIQNAKVEQARQDRLKREEAAKNIALAKIEAAGTPQKTLNSVLSGIENLQRFAAGGAGATDPNFAAPAGTPGEPGTVTPSLFSRLMKTFGIPILIGLAVTALWYFLKPKH